MTVHDDSWRFMRALLILVYMGDLGDIGYMGNLEAENEQQFLGEVKKGNGSITIFPMH